MNPLSPKSEILNLMTEIPANYKGLIKQPQDPKAKRVEKIAALLKKDALLIRDPGLIGRILKYTEKSVNPAINSFRKDLIQRHCCNVHNGVVKIIENPSVTDAELASAIRACPALGRLYINKLKFAISEEALKIFIKEKCENSDEKFWIFIRETQLLFKVNEVEIRLNNGESISYGEIILKQFVDNNIPVADLTEMYTLEFETGEQFPLPKAKLLLCGDFFQAMLSHNMNEVNTHIIHIEGASLNGFCDVLRKVETGNRPAPPAEEFQIASSFFQFEQAIKLPEGVYGEEDWIQTFGNPGKVPTPPKEFFQFWKANCNIKTHVGVYIPPSLDQKNLVTVKEIATRAQYSKWDVVLKGVRSGVENDPVKEGSWLIIERTVQKLGEGEEAQRAFCGHRLPLALDVMICSFMHFAKTGELLFEPKKWVLCEGMAAILMNNKEFLLMTERAADLSCTGVVRTWKFASIGH